MVERIADILSVKRLSAAAMELRDCRPRPLPEPRVLACLRNIAKPALFKASRLSVAEN
jgi:hypothetical protein